MKKIALIIAGIFISLSTMFADNDRYTKDVNQLPAISRQFISTYFNDANISHIVIEKNFFGVKGYEVLLTNGIDIEFNRSGEWKEVDGNHTIIPETIIPLNIASYVKTNFQGNDIITIEKETRECSVKLSNGLELTFNRKGNLIDIDD